MNGQAEVQTVQNWPEVESEIYWPNRWVSLTAITAILLAAGVGVFTIDLLPAGLPRWIAGVFTAFLALLGAFGLPSAISRVRSPGRVRHASPLVLPEVSRAPVIVEPSIVESRLLLELVEEAEGWQLRPAMWRWRNDQRWLLGMAVPLVAFATAASWFIHREKPGSGLPFSILFGSFLAVLCGGTAILILGATVAAGYRRLSCLSIPRSGDTLELDSPKADSPDLSNLTTELSWSALDKAGRRRIKIPRNLLRAVQLCPWKHVVDSSGETTSNWAVQGLLVLADPAASNYSRVPILLTSDVGTAARLMQRLAATLAVPYLFGADVEGFRAEQSRAKVRPPLLSGKMLS